MANLTKTQVRSAVRALLNDESRDLWSDSALDVLVQMTYDELWSEIMRNNSYFVSQLDTVTPTTPGLVDARLVADGGLLSQRFHRLQTLVRDSQTYRKADPRDVVLEGNAVVWAPDFRYVWLGEQLWIFPLATSSTVELRYAFFPTAFTSLVDTGSISWPTGAESALIFKVASRALVRGGLELRASYEHIADESFDRLLNHVRRRDMSIAVVWSPETGEDFGGQ